MGRNAPEIPAGIDYFGRGHLLSRIQARVSYGARLRMFSCFAKYASDQLCGTILDVGATPDLERVDSNCMLPWFRDAGLSVHLYSPEDIENLRRHFAFATIIPSQGFGKPLPVADRCFDWVSSSAVLEHVGSRQNQIAFIRDCARAGKGLFLTTPNRSHWLEFHTKLPLLHWLPKPLHRRLLALLGKSLWASEDHLNLVTRSELESLAEAAIGDAFTYQVESIRALGMTSNLVLLAKRKDWAR